MKRTPTFSTNRKRPVTSYADVPQMSAKEISDELLDNGVNYDLVIINFVNEYPKPNSTDENSLLIR